MKIAGTVLDKSRIETVVLPRQSGNIVIQAQAVVDFDEFDKFCEAPKPKTKSMPGGAQIPMVDDPEYLEAVSEYAKHQTNWMTLKSLEATKGLTWDTVKADDPSTWGNYRDELKEAGFTFAEIGRILRTISDACGLNQDKIDEATRSFLAAQAETQKE